MLYDYLRKTLPCAAGYQFPLPPTASSAHVLVVKFLLSMNPLTCSGTSTTKLFGPGTGVPKVSKTGTTPVHTFSRSPGRSTSFFKSDGGPARIFADALVTFILRIDVELISPSSGGIRV